MKKEQKQQNRLVQNSEDKIETLTQSKKSKTIPIVAIIIILLALLLAGGYWYLYVYNYNHGKPQTNQISTKNRDIAPTPDTSNSLTKEGNSKTDTTHDWNTYTNNEGGSLDGGYFNFKYPNNFILAQDNGQINSPNQMVLFVGSNNINKAPEADGVCGHIGSEAFQNQAKELNMANPGDDFTKALKLTVQNPEFAKVTINPNSIKLARSIDICAGAGGGVGLFLLSAITFKGNTEIGISTNIISLLKDPSVDSASNIAKQLDAGTYDSKVQTIYDQFNQIISTLKFTE